MRKFRVWRGDPTGGQLNEYKVEVNEGEVVHLAHKPVPTMRRELLELFDTGELSKYMTDDELAGLAEDGAN